MKAPLLGAFVLLAACSPPRPFFRTGPSGIPPDVINRPDKLESLTPQIRRICRGAGTPRGWVIIAYETGPESCADGRWDRAYSAAVIMYIADEPPGARVTICADQLVPSGWRRFGDDPEMACAGADIAGGKPTSLIIERAW